MKCKMKKVFQIKKIYYRLKYQSIMNKDKIIIKNYKTSKKK